MTYQEVPQSSNRAHASLIHMLLLTYAKVSCSRSDNISSTPLTYRHLANKPTINPARLLQKTH